MKPAGIILTYMRWRELKWLVFNIGLFLWQIVFMVMGTVYGKIKINICDEWSGLGSEIIGHKSGKRKYVIGSDKINNVLIVGGFWTYHWRKFICFWRRVWRAAQVCHVRLVLQKRLRFDEWLCVNFGWPKAELQPWRERWNDGKRFAYRDPTFDPSPEFKEAMIEYAYAQVGKRYDYLQLASYCLNLFVWIVWPPSWGREVFAWLNLRGGRETCSSGVTANLRWADDRGAVYDIEDGVVWIAWVATTCECRYDTAMVPPCLFPLSENWGEG